MSAFLVVQNAFSQIVINEYSCANSTSAGDPDFLVKWKIGWNFTILLAQRLI